MGDEVYCRHGRDITFHGCDDCEDERYHEAKAKEVCENCGQENPGGGICMDCVHDVYE